MERLIKTKKRKMGVRMMDKEELYKTIKKVR